MQYHRHLYIYLLSIMFFCANNQTQAQLPFKRLRVDINLLGNFSWFNNNNSFGALGASIEPKFSITKNWSIGLLAGVKMHLNPLKNMNLLKQKIMIGTAQNSTPGMLFQYQFTNDFHLLSSHSIRPYIGLGLGAVTNKPLGKNFIFKTQNGNNEKGIAKDNDLKIFFIISPRFGIDIWHIRINMVYDIIALSTKQLEFDGQINMDGKQIPIKGNHPSYNHLTGQVIFYFGGGKR